MVTRSRGVVIEVITDTCEHLVYHCGKLMFTCDRASACAGQNISERCRLRLKISLTKTETNNSNYVH